MHRPLSLLALAALLTACGSVAGDVLADLDEADLSDPSTVADLASFGSPPSVLWVSQAVVALPAPGVSCPQVETSDDGLDIDVSAEGCQDEDGLTWSGSARYRFQVQGDTEADLEPVDVRVDELTRSETVDCGEGQTATASQAATGTISIDDKGRFDVDLRIDATDVDPTDCTLDPVTWAYAYSGSYQQEGDGERWSGSGELGGTGLGRASVRTRDEVDDTTCSFEAESGTTTLQAGGAEAVITYDGATDCDEDSTVTWTLDGEGQGELTGVACSSAAGAAGWVWLAGLASLGALGRRRRLTSR